MALGDFVNGLFNPKEFVTHRLKITTLKDPGYLFLYVFPSLC